MFNIILALSVGILIGWNFHSFFSALTPPKILRTDINISQAFSLDINESNITILPSPTQKEIIKEETPKEKVVQKKTYEPIKTSFYSLLHNGLFSDAMALYQEASYERILFYRTTIENYFKDLNTTDQEKAIREILQYIDIDPENSESQLFLAQIYKEKKEYKESIKILYDLLTRMENEIAYSNLMDTTKVYIDSLKESKSYQEIQKFLEAQIRLGTKSSFFIMILAEHHIFMQSFDTATILLKEIEFDEEYGERAKELLNKIDKNETNKSEYSYKIPLKKEGSHFTIEVTIDNTHLTLLLDTGATLTLINEEKVPASLTTINDNVMLKTAGGEVSAQLKMAQTLTVGEIKLENFKVTTSSFEQDKADGLLGMNFFKKFRFKIDQDKKLLFLSEK
jgi:clan AA aspartic protease (TIGR02281 family)